MKMTTLALLSIFLFSLSSNPLLRANELEEPVKDDTGEPLQRGVKYYILPVDGGQGGGLALGKNRINTPCPLDVVQEQQEANNGLPVTFSPADPNEGMVRVGTDLNIKFSEASTCGQSSTVWNLGVLDFSVTRAVVITGGVEGNPGCSTSSNWFVINAIEENSHDYKFMFCPSVCDESKPFCVDIGIFVDKEGTRRLAINKEPFKVRFKKVS